MSKPCKFNNGSRTKCWWFNWTNHADLWKIITSPVLTYYVDNIVELCKPILKIIIVRTDWTFFEWPMVPSYTTAIVNSQFCTQGMRDVAETVVTEEFCSLGALCNSANETALIALLTAKHLPELLVITVGTGSSLVGEHTDRLSLNLFGQQPRMLELAGLYAPSIPVVLFVYSASPVNLTVAINSAQVQFC